MANRFPLILDTTDNQLKELADGDSLDLTGNSIIGVQNITAAGNISASDILIGDQSITTSIDYNDLQSKPTFATVAFTGIYSDINELPPIPTDIAELTDNSGLIGGGAFTDLSDGPDDYIGKAGEYLRVNLTETGIEFSPLSGGGIVTDQDIIDALGYTPYDAVTNSQGFITGITGQDISDALGYNPYDGPGNPLGFINDSTGIISALGYTPYNATTNSEGFINSTLGITDTLGYTPYDGVTNPSAFITSVSETNVLDALGYTPYNATANTEGFINDAQGVTDVLGYTPYDGTTNSSGFLTTITDTQVIGALGFTPYSNANPNNFINLTNISAIGDITYNQLTGVITFNNASGFLTSITDTLIIDALGYTPYNAVANSAAFINDSSGIIGALGYTPYNGTTNLNGFLTAEADTLDSVTLRSSTTTNSIQVGGLTAGAISGTGLTLSGGIEFSAASIVIDGPASSALRIGGASDLTLGSSGDIVVQNAIVPNTNNAHTLGTTGTRFSNIYSAQGVFYGTTLSSNAALATISATSGSINVTTAATGRTHVTTGTFRLPNLTSVQRTAITPTDGDMIYEINRIVPQVYFGGQWRDVLPQVGAQPASPWFGMIAIADGGSWNPKGNGDEALMCYLNDAWVVVA